MSTITQRKLTFGVLLFITNSIGVLYWRDILTSATLMTGNIWVASVIILLIVAAIAAFMLLKHDTE
ncbi:MAG: hypothetical protein J07AB43_00420 [Candidatus Nanosalina sp. J07AB43]|jgi:hypothetical protein|nr:MAG: hypothetical protein J07AB43_00420 [Candidatus Nanosalina sp. J07AB43]